MTAVTRPSRIPAIATFSLVASPCMSTRTKSTSAGSFPSSLSALRKGSSIAGRKIRPLQVQAPRISTPFFAVPTYTPVPGFPSGNFAGRTSWCAYTPGFHCVPAMVPPVSTSIPFWSSPQTRRGVIPNPEAEFSPFAITSSIWRCSTRSASVMDDRRPGDPTMSP